MIRHKILKRANVLLAMVVILCLSSFSNAHALSASQVFEKASKSTVVVINYDNTHSPVGFGSGVVLQGGRIATNCHVLKNAAQAAVIYQGREYPATPEFLDWERDVCSIKAQGLKARPVTLGSIKNVKVGARVYAIGAPRGLELTLSEGIVSGIRQVEGGHYIQTTAPISPGSSGGGLFDQNGRLIGLTSFFHREGQNLNFALPVEWIVDLPKRFAKKQPSGTPMDEWNQKALELAKKQDWQRLKLHAQKWLKKHPNSAEAWHVLGSAYANTGEVQKAIQAMQQVCRIRPDSVLGWNGLGLTYFEIGETHKAIETFRKAVRIDLKNFDGWTGLGMSYSKAGRRNEAFEAYGQALKINPLHVPAIYGLGLEYGKAGQKEEVRVVYRLLKELDPAVAQRFVEQVGLR